MVFLGTGCLLLSSHHSGISAFPKIQGRMNKMLHNLYGIGWWGTSSLELLRYLRKAGQKKTETQDENKKFKKKNKKTNKQRKLNYTNLKSNCI